MAKPVLPAKRFSLNGLIDGWTDEHYIEYKPFSVADATKIKGINEQDLSQVDSFIDLLKAHFVSGKWLVSDDDGNNVRTENMAAENVIDLPAEVTGLWLKEAMGNASPKPLAN